MLEMGNFITFERVTFGVVPSDLADASIKSSIIRLSPTLNLVKYWYALRKSKVRSLSAFVLVVFR